MANIRPYTQQIAPSLHSGAAGRRATAEDMGLSASDVAPLVNALETTGEKMQQHAERQDVTDLQGKMAQATADWDGYIRDRLQQADPNDQTIVTKTLNDYDEYFSKIAGSAQTDRGQQYVQQAGAALRASIQQKVASGQVELAGIAAKQNYDNGLTALSSSVFDTPGTLDSALAQQQASLDALVNIGTLSPVDAAKLKASGEKELTVASVRGLINKNPVAAFNILQGPSLNARLDGQAKAVLMGEAEQGVHALEIEHKRLIAEGKQAKAEAQMQTQDALLKKLAEGTLTTKDVMESNLDPFGSGGKNQFLGLIAARADTPAGVTRQQQAAQFNDLFGRIHLPDDDPRKIVNENQLNDFAAHGLISFDQLNQLRGEVQNKRTFEGKTDDLLKQGVINMAKSKLLKPDATGLADPDASVNYQAWLADFLKRYQEARDKGEDMAKLMDPRNPNWLGGNIDQFQSTNEEIIAKQADRLLNGGGDDTAETEQRATPPANDDSLLGALTGNAGATGVSDAFAGGAQSPLQTLEGVKPAEQPSPAPAATATGKPGNGLVSAGGKPARLPGESPADYLKRTKGQQ